MALLLEEFKTSVDLDLKDSRLADTIHAFQNEILTRCAHPESLKNCLTFSGESPQEQVAELAEGLLDGKCNDKDNGLGLSLSIY